MKIAGWIVAFLLAATVVGLAALWGVQNADQTVQFRLDLGSMVGAWQMASPAQASLAVLIAFAAGVLATALPLWLWAGALKRRVRALERQIAFSSEA